MEERTNNKNTSNRRLVDKVLEQLQTEIFSGKYQIGDKLPTELELMDFYEVGRSTVREVVRILVHAGILEIKHGSGTYIKSISLPARYSNLQKEYDLEHIYEVRKMLDLEVGELAVINRTEEDIQIMQNYLNQRKEYLNAGDYSEYVEADVKFHYAMAQSSKNQLLIDFYNDFRPILKEYLSHLIVKDIKQYDDSTFIHDQLLKSIKEKNRDKVKYLILANLKEI